jgi:hypothetical protein
MVARPFPAAFDVSPACWRWPGHHRDIHGVSAGTAVRLPDGLDAPSAADLCFLAPL